MTKAVLFDCDGTLVDTEELSAVAFTDVLRRDFGIDIPWDNFRDTYMGMSLANIVRAICLRFERDLPFEAIRDGYAAGMEANIATHMRVLPESVAFVRELAGRPAKMAVCSNGVRRLVLQELAVGGYGDLFPEAHVFTGDQVARPKPEPDLFLYAAQVMGAAPESCVVVEDSAAGVRAGVAAGMRVLGYTGLAHDPAAQAQTLEKAGAFKVFSRLEAIEDWL
ncbi:MAG: HAD family phosphatase [Rhodospirillales bacterium]|nr:HAD family phosphatase [Alphaproteobacteria bacterium]MCB9986934.1 HAD family phosphatase [Rhodospirillales bacterium]USO08291.1 MAG: HAD family phosphatase [Rhodospirillales bacterium]